RDRWRAGDVADTYAMALQTLRRLQGDETLAHAMDGERRGSESGDDTGASGGGGSGSEGGMALVTTVGKLERARKAMDVLEELVERGRKRTGRGGSGVERAKPGR
ncbi:hypothetical protein KEM52_003981, partial [Ascosphaera acerosa]